MIKQSQKLLLSKQKTQEALQMVSLLRQAAYYQSTAAGNSAGRFQLNYKPAPIQSKLWKNALEVSLLLSLRFDYETFKYNLVMIVGHS